MEQGDGTEKYERRPAGRSSAPEALLEEVRPTRRRASPDTVAPVLKSYLSNLGVRVGAGQGKREGRRAGSAALCNGAPLGLGTDAAR